MPARFRLFASLPGFEPTYAPHPVWSGSTPKPVQFTPMPKKAAVKLWHRARDFDRATKQPGLHGGAIGHNALQVLHSLIFDFMNFRTGRLDPGYKAIADKANVCERAVASGIQRLHDLGILTWVRRCAESWQDGRYVRRQQTNAYCILPTGWRGYVSPAAPPPPLSGTWGAPLPMPSVLEAAVMARRTGGTLQDAIRVLDTGPAGGLEAALASLARGMVVRGMTGKT
jgi:hypothetical protein